MMWRTAYMSVGALKLISWVSRRKPELTLTQESAGVREVPIQAAKGNYPV